MISTDALETIDHTTLDTITGGFPVEGDGRIDLGPRTSTDGTNRGRQPRPDPYAACVHRVTSQPGWTGRQVIQQCGRPPQ